MNNKYWHVREVGASGGENTMARCALSGVAAGRRPLLLLYLASLIGCVSESTPVSSSSRPMSDLSGQWEVDYAKSDSIQTQINARFREVQREMRRRQDAMERGVSYQGQPVGDVDTLIALAKMAELVTESSVLDIEQNSRWLRIEREDSFALSCQLQGEVEPVSSLLGGEQCWWDGHQWHFLVQLPDGLMIEHRFVISEDNEALAQRTVMGMAGSATRLEVVRIFSRYDATSRGYRCTETLSKGRVCTTEAVDRG